MTNRKKKVKAQSTQGGRLIRIMWIAAGAVVLGVILFFVFLSFQDLPDFQQLENPEFEKASLIYDNRGVEFGRYYTQNRVPVLFEDLNPHLVNALVATEDDVVPARYSRKVADAYAGPKRVLEASIDHHMAFDPQNTPLLPDATRWLWEQLTQP